MAVPLGVQSARITVCTFDKNTYHQGETGDITVTIYNDKEDTIRVTELTATIDYHYTGGTVYLQTFFTNTILPEEIQQGQSGTFHVPFSLPTNIASGYTNVNVKAETELWSTAAERWFGSEHPTYHPTLYIESPYKQQYEDQLKVNNDTSNMMYLFGVTTLVFAAVAGSLFIANRKTRYIARPAA